MEKKKLSKSVAAATCEKWDTRGISNDSRLFLLVPSQGNSWGKMMPIKWCIILFLGVISLLGLPTTAESDDPSNEIKSSSASECRAHIEKALEQYWDQSQPSDSNNPNIDSSLNTRQQNNNKDASEIQDEDDDDDDEPMEDDDNSDEEDDSLDSDIQNNRDNDNLSNDETNNAEEEDEDEDEDDEETDEDDQDNQNDDENNENAKGENEVDDDDDDEEEENEDREDKVGEIEAENDSLLNHSKNVTDNSSDIEDDDETNDEDEIDDDNDEIDDEDDEIDDEDDGDEEENEQDLELKEESQNKDKAAESDEKSETNEIVDETKEEEDDEEDEVEDDDSESEQSDDKIKIEIQIENDKVTGEADSSSSRMDSKFHDEKPILEQPKATKTEEKNLSVPVLTDNKESEDFDEEDSEDETNDENDLTIENIYEEEEDESTSEITYRSRDHVDVILGLDEIVAEFDAEEEKLAQNIFKDIKKIYLTQIKPIEMLYKYTDSTTRVLGDAEIFNKPMLIFLGPWNSGKTTIINYLLGNERTTNALKTGTGRTDMDFTILTYGETHRIRSGTELAADWRYAGVQRFGQDFLDHFRGVECPHTLLKKITIVDTPGILENKKTAERGYSLSDAFQWFIDRSDAINVVLDPSKVDIGAELGSVVDQLKGRDARFLLNKADTIRRSDLMRVVGQLFWNLSPLMSSTEAPLIYAVSLTTKPFHPSAPSKFLVDQEKNYFYDMKDILNKRVENRILYARRHAVRVRNHAKMIDCYLATYYRHKSIFSNKRNVAKSIIENPYNYNLFDGFGDMTNVSRYDLPNPSAYKEFFKLHPLYDFKPLASTCSYFRGCPMDKLDLAITKDIPELLAKYKKMKQTDSLKHNR